MLSEALKAAVQEAYTAFLAARSFHPRAGQKQMIGRVASFLGAIEQNEAGHRVSESAVLAIEAGTGTGKTAAYLLAVLPLARAAGKKVVIATGTVALQGQLVDRDIPDILAATNWDYSFALAKGRRRYLCPLKLQQCEDALKASQAGLLMYADELAFQPDAAFADTLGNMSAALADGTWDGDRDNWPEALAGNDWQALTVDRPQCAGYRCRMYSECCFFQAREALEDADCIVANHDLVLADLMLGGGAILPVPEDTIYIFDEAHKLAGSALNHLSSQCRLTATAAWLEDVEKILQIMAPVFSEVPGFATQLNACSDMAKLTRPLIKQCYPLFETLLPDSHRGADPQYRFANGRIEEHLQVESEQLAALFKRLTGCFEQLHNTLESALDDTLYPVPKVDVEQYFQVAGQWQARANSVCALWLAMASPSAAAAPAAKWLTLEDGGDIRVSVSPIIAGPALEELLWQRGYASILTSATLRSLGSFERLRRELAIERAPCEAVPPAFDYAAAGTLCVPDFAVDGGDPQAHTATLIAHLPGLLLSGAQSLDKVAAASGSLVLFASRRQMQEVAAEIADTLHCQLLMQGDLAVTEIVKRHRTTINGGADSVIFGLASFAEGMDLPGNYCTHVVIAKLPFAVPDDPIQAALAEWIEEAGRNAFRELSLPDASLRLIQACGRLLRNESDTGRVTILDRRILSKAYGRQLLDALPAFRRELA